MIQAEAFKALASSSKGIVKLRQLILELAVRGLLVPQDPNDEPASVMLEKINAEKQRLVNEGKIKKQPSLPEISNEEKPFDLPISWTWVRLGDVTNYGFTEKAEPNEVDDQTWVLELEDIEKVSSRLLDKIRYAERQFKSSKNHFYSGDVLYGKLRPYLDKVLVADENGVCTTEIIPVRGYMGLSPNFLRLVMKSPYFTSYANESTHGMSLPRLGTDKARLALIPLVSEPEQQRIVEKVDGLMALCDQLDQHQNHSNTVHQQLLQTLLESLTQAVDNEAFQKIWSQIAAHFDTLFTTEASVDQLKQVILQLAVMGKLVPQDPNDEPASVLLEKIAEEKARLVKEGKIKKQNPLPKINEEEKPFQLPIGWEWVRLGRALKKITDGTHHSPLNGEKGEYLYISAKNIKSEGIMLSNATYVTREVHDEIYSRCDPEYGDLLYIKDGATTGIVTINNLKEPFSMLSSLALLKVPKGILNSYLLLSLRSPYFYNEMRAGMTGVAITRVTLNKLDNAIISIPSLAEQHRIVAKVDELMAICDLLKSRISKSQQTQEHLATAIVEKAVA